jgi:hypothetical protein
MNDNFTLDEKFNVVLVSRRDGKERQILVESSMEKGYIYACLYFYDEVKKEIDKMDKMVRKIQDEVMLEMSEDNTPVMLIEMSNRIRSAIGDDSLDALIKEILAEKTKHIALVPEEKEVEKFNFIKDSIFTELLANFFDVTFAKASSGPHGKTLTFSKEYVAAMTDRQRRLLAPALRMVGFINQIKMSNFNLDSATWTLTYLPELLPEKFDAKEEEIKDSIKAMMEKEL